MDPMQFDQLIEALNKVDCPTIIISIIGAAISAFVAYKVAKFQANKSDEQVQKQIDENRQLEKELFFYKSRYDSIGACMNALDEVIDSFKKALSTSRDIDYIKLDIQDTGLNKAMMQRVNQLYEPLDAIKRFENDYRKVIWRSYFSDDRLVSIERQTKDKSNKVILLFRFYEKFTKDVFKKDYKILSYALENYIFNELMILWNLYNAIYSIDSLYFTDQKYVESIITTIIDSYGKNINFLEQERDEWRLLLDKKDLDGILLKQKNLMKNVDDTIDGYGNRY